MKRFLLLLSVLLVFQLLSASAQSVSDGVVCPNKTHTPAPDHSALSDHGMWFVPVDIRQCAFELNKAILNCSFLASNLQKCQEDLNVATVEWRNKTETLQQLAQCGTKFYTLDTKNTENLNTIEMLNTKLTEAEKNISILNTKLKTTPVEVADLRQQIEELIQEIKDLKKAQEQIPVNVTCPENSMFAFVNTMFAFVNIFCIRFVVGHKVLFAIIRALSKWRLRSHKEKEFALKESANVKNAFNDLRNKIEIDRIQALKKKRLLQIWKADTNYRLSNHFIVWRLGMKTKVITVPSIAASVFEVMIQTHRHTTLQLVRNANEKLQTFCKDLAIQAIPQDLEVFKRHMFEKIKEIQSNIAWVHDPMSPINYDNLKQILIQKAKLWPQALLKLQKFCRRFLVGERLCLTIFTCCHQISSTWRMKCDCKTKTQARMSADRKRAK